MIKAVIFDIDGVLIDSADANVESYRRLLTKHGHRPLTKYEYVKISHMTMKQTIRLAAEEATDEEVEAIWIDGKNTPPPFELYKIPPFVNETLPILHEKYKLALVSNRTKNGIRNYLHFAKTDAYFSVRISSEDITHPKPHPESLFLAAKELGVEPSECVYVGDTRSDLLSAKAAGMRTILYTEKKITGAEYHTASFREIPALIEGL